MKLLLREIADVYIRKNFQLIDDAIREFGLYRGKFTFFEIELAGAVTNYRHKHGLGFVPKDVLQTSLKGAGLLTWNYASFDREYLDITTTGACTVRAFVGSYEEGSSA